MDLHFVYALTDSRFVGASVTDPLFINPSAVLYVGITTDPNGRYQTHLSSPGTSNLEKSEELERLRAKGVELGMVILEVVYNNRVYAYQLETDWIQYYLIQGAPLLNSHKVKNVSKRNPIFQRLEEPLFTPVSSTNLTFPLACGLEAVTYGIEEVGTFYYNILLSWLKKNELIYWLTGSMGEYTSLSDAWASIGILPLPENIISLLLRGVINVDDIQIEDILTYEPSHAYTCYIFSVTCRPGREKELSRLFQHALVRLCSLGVYIGRIYALALSDDKKYSSPLSFVKKHSFSPVPSISSNAWGLCLDTWNFSSSVSKYQHFNGKAVMRSLTDEHRELLRKKDKIQKDIDRLHEIEATMRSRCGKVLDSYHGSWLEVPAANRLLLPKSGSFRGIGKPD